jgi:hypothetical protein
MTYAMHNLGGRGLPATYAAIQRVDGLGVFPRGVDSLQVC